MALAKIVGFEVMPRTPVVDPAGELTRGDPAALEVVEPGALTEPIVQLSSLVMQPTLSGRPGPGFGAR